MKNVFKEIILENQELKVFNFVNRDIKIPLNLEIIVSLIGSRRSGKTYLFYDLINQLIRNGVPKEKILFINFEDERLNIQQKDLDLIIQAYQEIYPDVALHEVYLFFDEIQNVSGWQKFVRRMFDTKSKHIFITGSNSKLLSTEIATELRGRTVSYTVYPYSFKEYLASKKAPTDINTPTKKSKIIHLAEQYMLGGGFPELINFDNRNRLKILQQYFNVMIYRDIVERYRISNPEVLKFFIKKIFVSVTTPFSINKIYNDLKSMGYKISNKYLYEFADYCNAVFLTLSIHRFNYSELKQLKSDKKAYVIDTGLLSAIDFSMSENKGKLFENMVALEFMKNDRELFYYKDTYECDFIVNHENNYKAIQVAYTLKDESTRKREIRGLLGACQYLKSNHGTIVTFEEEEQFESKGVLIDVVPFYKIFGGFNNQNTIV